VSSFGSRGSEDLRQVDSHSREVQSKSKSLVEAGIHGSRLEKSEERASRGLCRAKGRFREVAKSEEIWTIGLEGHTSPVRETRRRVEGKGRSSNAE
jgi:hypothetical protein